MRCPNDKCGNRRRAARNECSRDDPRKLHMQATRNGLIFTSAHHCRRHVNPLACSLFNLHLHYEHHLESPLLAWPAHPAPRLLPTRDPRYHHHHPRRLAAHCSRLDRLLRARRRPPNCLCLPRATKAAAEAPSAALVVATPHSPPPQQLVFSRHGRPSSPDSHQEWVFDFSTRHW